MEVMKAIWNFIQNQLLGMKWLNNLVEKGLLALGLDTTNRWVGSMHSVSYTHLDVYKRQSPESITLSLLKNSPRILSL